ncbi:MAG: cbb3-type cytochrome c oxidase subunit 3 [Fidelibacterota bacterium]|nr:MAG: cbb3-type cytochrome c oxidase subunit 3 [Candidatus Neomarinimicrobiota bacterium]
MFRDLLGLVDGISGYRILALLLFFSTFILIAVRALLMDKQERERMKRLPLDPESHQSQHGELSSG